MVAVPGLLGLISIGPMHIGPVSRACRRFGQKALNHWWTRIRTDDELDPSLGQNGAASLNDESLSVPDMYRTIRVHLWFKRALI